MTQQAVTVLDGDFRTTFKGKFYGVLRWHQLDEVWKKVNSDAKSGWYCYKVGKTPPTEMKHNKELNLFIKGLNTALHDKHEEDYCGVVYVDDLETPSFIKVFDPKNMGTSCSIGKISPLPEWIISKIPPQDISRDDDKPEKTPKRWLGSLFSK